MHKWNETQIFVFNVKVGVLRLAKSAGLNLLMKFTLTDKKNKRRFKNILAGHEMSTIFHCALFN